MKKTLASLILFALIQVAGATVYYWDPEAASTPTGANLAGTWNTTTAQWSTTSAQTASPVAFVAGYAVDFYAGSTTVTTPFVVTLNTTISIAGIFNGTLTPPGAFVTISGSGSLTLVAGADAFASGGSDGGTTTISVPLTGPGQIAMEGAGTTFFYGTNTFSGGTSIGYTGVTAFTGTASFNNSASFGTGTMIMNANGTGAVLSLTGSATVTLTNAVAGATANLGLTGNAAGLTFSGPWTLGNTTPALNVLNLVTISGSISGAGGGITKYGSGTLVLNGSNSYTGLTTLSNGILSVTADDNLGTAPASANYDISLNGGTFNSSNTFTLNPKRLILLGANSFMGVSTGNTLTYGGSITGTAALTKNGAGTLILGGANGYAGITTVSIGTLEADTTSGSATGTNTVNVVSGATLSGVGIVSGPVSATGSITPGTPAGPGILTIGNGLNLSSAGTFAWNLFSNSTSSSFSSIALIGGNLRLGGTSKLSVNFDAAATPPNTNNPFWLTQEAWPVIATSGSAGDSNNSQFATIVNGTYASGNFTNYVSGNGNITLLYLPNFSIFDNLYDAGPNFFSGENLILTNFSGLTLYTWSSANAGISVSNWTLVGQMAEQTLAPQLPGYSRYTINIVPTDSPTFYIAGNSNTAPFVISPVPVAIVTTPDFMDFTVTDTNVSIDPSGILGLLPPAPVILPGATYSGGQFQFQFSTSINQSYTVQSSTDLINWTNIMSGVTSASPTMITDTNAAYYTNQFYRVLLNASF